MSSIQNEIASALQDRYRVLDEIGRGGMATVYKAEDIKHDRIVALKVLSPDLSVTIGSGRFEREIKVAARLAHPNILPVHDSGSANGLLFYTMPFVEGESVRHRLDREGQLPIEDAVQITAEVADALGYAHEQGVIHRDIKPENILLLRGRAVIADFGIARAATTNATDKLTSTGISLGTAAYMSPEQSSGEAVDARSDIYSLGCTLYEMLAGEPPFTGKSAAAVMARHLIDPVPSIRTVRGSVPPELEEVVYRSLEKSPADRFTSMADLRAALIGGPGTWTRSRPAAAPPRASGTLPTFSDIFRRPRLPVGAVALAVVALVAVIIGIGYFVRARPHVPNAEALRLYAIGANAIRAGSYFQASRALELAVRADDQFVLAHARLAEAFMELDYSDKAKDEILRASELTPNRSLLSKVDNRYLDALTATVRRAFPAAVGAYSEVVNADHTKTEAYVDLGRAFEKNSQTDKAIESYSGAIKRDPHSAAAFLRLGILYGRKRDLAASNRAFDKAEENYQSLGNVEGRAEVALQRGVVLNDVVGKPDDARAQLEQARDLAKVVNAPYQQLRILFQLSSVALKQNKGTEAKQFATQALEIAQANQMETMTARGYIELGYVCFLTADYESAERNFLQGLDYAHKVGARMNEARAQLSLASLYEQRGEADKALTYQEPAQKFYRGAGYRTETNQAMNIRARLYGRKGDFTSALASLQDQRKFAEQMADQPQIAAAHTSIGSLFLDLERYPEALQEFEQSYQTQKALNNQLNLGYALMDRGDAQWHLGRRKEASSDMAQASEIAKKDEGSYKTLQVAIELAQAEMALSDRTLGDAIAGADRALALGAQSKVATVRGKYIKGLAQALSGQARPGQMLCDEAVNAATSVGDPLLLARAQLALAEASLAAGDAERAMTSAQQARTFFNSAGLAEAEWQAWLIEGLATQKAGDAAKARDCLTRATELLASLEQKWGAEVFQSYLKRKDVQSFRGQLGRTR